MGLEWTGSATAPEHETAAQPLTVKEIGGAILDGLAAHERRIENTVGLIISGLREDSSSSGWDRRYDRLLNGVVSDAPGAKEPK